MRAAIEEQATWVQEQPLQIDMASSDQAPEAQAQGGESIASFHSCPKCRALYRTGPGHCSFDGARLEPFVKDPTLDRRIGDYRVTELLGEGAMGRVYRAIHLPTGQPVAIKTLFGEVAASESMRTRFRLEARLASGIFHRNVISAIDVLYIGSQTYIVLELANRGCLERYIERHGPLEPTQALELIRGVLAGLSALHALGVVHRDIKPGNILLHEEESGQLVARVTDLGVARWMDDCGPRTTGAGFVVGSPSFMAPEQAKGAACDVRSDIYAAGATLYTLLIGKAPFSGEAQQVLFEKATKTCPALGEVEHFEPELRRLLSRFTEYNVERRPKSADEALLLLEGLIATEKRKRRWGKSARPRARAPRVGPRLVPQLKMVAAAAGAIAIGAGLGASPMAAWLASKLRQPSIKVEALPPETPSLKPDNVGRQADVAARRGVASPVVALVQEPVLPSELDLAGDVDPAVLDG